MVSMNSTTTYRYFTQKGMSLLELIVSASISLVIIAGVINVYGESLYTQQVNSTINQMNIKGSSALEQLSQIVEHAGYSTEIKTARTAPFTHPTSGQFGLAETIIVKKDGDSSSVQLRLAYDDRTPILDCLARPIPVGSESHMEIYLDKESLMCKSMFYENGSSSNQEIGVIQTDVKAFLAHALVTLNDQNHQVVDSTTSGSDIASIDAIHLELVIKSTNTAFSHSSDSAQTITTTYGADFTTDEAALIRSYSQLSRIPNG